MASAAELAVLLSLKDQTGGGLGKMHGDLDNIEKKSGSLIGTFAKVGAAATAGFAVAGVGAIAGFVKAAMESQQIMAQTQAVIESTGGAAGYTAQQIADMATQLSKTRPFDDEVIQSAENLLLTFTNIGHDVMPQATAAVLDMATALHEDTSSAAQQLGKALQDPIQGVTALQRVGVKLTESQKDLVKSLVESGDMAGAQAVILKELQTEFGGSAEAAGKTFAGSLTILKTQLGNVAEDIGTKFLPILTIAATWLSANLPKAIDFLMGYFNRLWNFLSGPLTTVWVAVRDSVLTLIMALQGNWTDDSRITPLHRAIGRIGSVIHDQVIPAVKQMVGWFQEYVWPVFEAGIGIVQKVIKGFGEGGLSGAFHGLLDGVKGFVDAYLNYLGGLAGIGQMLVDFIKPYIPVVIDALHSLIDKAVAWLTGPGFQMFQSAMAALGATLWQWVKDNVGPLLAQLGDLLTQARDWLINTGGPMLHDAIATYTGPILAAIGEAFIALLAWLKDTGIPETVTALVGLSEAFVAWVQPIIDPLLSALGDLLLQLGNWLIDTALPEIASHLAEWGAQFVAWVGPQIVPMLSELGSLLLALGDWLITTALPTIITNLAQWGAQFVEWVAPQIPPLLAALGNLLGELLVWIVTTALPTLITSVAQWGEAFIVWVATDVLPKLPGALADILSSIGSWVAGVAGDLASYGADMAASLLQGIADGIYNMASETVGAALDYIASLVPDTLKKLWNMHSPSRVTYDIGTQLMAGLANAILDSADNQIRPALDNIATLITGALTDIANAVRPIAGDIAQMVGSALQNAAALQGAAPGIGAAPVPGNVGAVGPGDLGIGPQVGGANGNGSAPANGTPGTGSHAGEYWWDGQWWDPGDDSGTNHDHPPYGKQSGNLGGTTLNLGGGGSGSRMMAAIQQTAARTAASVAVAVTAPVINAARTAGDPYSQVGPGYTGGYQSGLQGHDSGNVAYSSVTSDYLNPRTGLHQYSGTPVGGGHGLQILMDGLVVGWLTGRRHVRGARMQRNPVGCS